MALTSEDVQNTEQADKRSKRILVTAQYSMILAAGIIGGTLLHWGEYGPYDIGNAIKMPFASLAIGLVMGVTAFGLFARNNKARLLFFAAAPWAALALAASYPQMLWLEDMPYTILMVLIYAPLIFLLSRAKVLQSVGVSGAGWFARGGAVLLVGVIIMGIARLVVGASPPSGGGGVFGHMSGMNEYVQRMVFCDVPLWHYVFGLFAVASVPL